MSSTHPPSFPRKSRLSRKISAAGKTCQRRAFLNLKPRRATQRLMLIPMWRAAPLYALILRRNGDTASMRAPHPLMQWKTPYSLKRYGPYECAGDSCTKESDSPRQISRISFRISHRIWHARFPRHFFAPGNTAHQLVSPTKAPNAPAIVENCPSSRKPLRLPGNMWRELIRQVAQQEFSLRPIGIARSYRRTDQRV